MKESLTLAQKVLLAALKCADGVTDKSFTAEALSVQAWKMDRNAFGLRGFENEYPDSNKLFKSIDSKGGLVARALIAKVGDRTFKVTAAGLAQAAALEPAEEDFRKPDRGLAAEVNFAHRLGKLIATSQLFHIHCDRSSYSHRNQDSYF